MPPALLHDKKNSRNFPEQNLGTISHLQDPKPNSFFGSTLGAVIESYYRSGLNSWLNAKLTGKPPADMFPMFHVQIPTRVLYINGFKVGAFSSDVKMLVDTRFNA